MELDPTAHQVIWERISKAYDELESTTIFGNKYVLIDGNTGKVSATDNSIKALFFYLLSNNGSVISADSKRKLKAKFIKNQVGIGNVFQKALATEMVRIDPENRKVKNADFYLQQILNLKKEPNEIKKEDRLREIKGEVQAHNQHVDKHAKILPWLEDDTSPEKAIKLSKMTRGYL